MRLYTTGSNKGIWDTKTGQYVLKHLKMGTKGPACFTNVRYKQQLGFGFTLDVPRAGGIYVETVKGVDVGEDCKRSSEKYERAPDPTKSADPKLWNMPPYVEAECDAEHLNECELNKFRHRMEAQLTLWHPPVKGSNLQSQGRSLGRDRLSSPYLCGMAPRRQSFLPNRSPALQCRGEQERTTDEKESTSVPNKTLGQRLGRIATRTDRHSQRVRSARLSSSMRKEGSRE